MLRYLQALGHRIHPYAIPAPPRVSLNEEEAESIVDHLKETPETANERNASIAVNTAFSVAQAAIGGVMFVVGEELFRRENNFEDEDLNAPEIINRNGDLAILGFGCVVAEVVLGCAKSLVNNSFFKTSNVATGIKNGIRAMTPAQVEQALQICSQDEGDLGQMIDRLGIFSGNRMQLSYMIGGAIAASADVEENQKYLLLAAGKVVSSFLLERIEKFAAKYVGETQYFVAEFLNDFSAEKQDEIKKSLLKELQLHVGCKEDTKQALIGAAATFAFLGTVHNSPIPTPEDESLKENILAQAANFAIGSMGSATVVQISNLLREVLKKDNRVEPERNEQEDVEQQEDDESPRSLFRSSSAQSVLENSVSLQFNGHSNS